MYCGEEITTKLNRDGIGWEDKEIKNVLNYYFYHPCKIVGRNLKGNIEIFSGIKKKEKKIKHFCAGVFGPVRPESSWSWNEKHYFLRCNIFLVIPDYLNIGSAATGGGQLQLVEAVDN